MNFRSFLILVSILFVSFLSHADPKIGVVLMHGKQGSPKDRSLEELNKKMLDADMVVIKPEMPWSNSRFIDGDWDKAINEISSQVKQLQEQGITKIVLVGHSLGSPAAMSYASRYPNQISAIALLAPGHVPHFYSLCIPYSPIKLCALKDGGENA